MNDKARKKDQQRRVKRADSAGKIPATEQLSRPPRQPNGSQGKAPQDTQDLNRELVSTASVSAASQHLNTGQQFGKYRIEKLLGEGGMGSVYLAVDSQLARRVALKIPKLPETDESEVRERFLREAKAVAALRHPNICPIHDYGNYSGRPFLVMAFIEGSPLTRYIKRDKPIAERQAVLLVRKLALALEEAHERGVLHRDLKPANIMIDHRKEPIVMDFGLAHCKTHSGTRLTQTGLFMGTPAYSSPEQIRNDGNSLGVAADIYSLGVVLFELLVGRLPFEGDSVAGLLSQVLTEEPPNPRSLNSNLSVQAELICLKAISKSEDDRFSSMKEFASALTGHLNGKQVISSANNSDLPTAVESSNPDLSGNDLLNIDLQEEMKATVPKKRRPIAEQPATNQQKSMTTWIVGGVAAGLATFMAIVLGIVFFINTPTGSVRLELSGPTEDIDVTVNGEQIDLRVDGKAYQIEVGSHEMKVSADGFKSVSRKFEVTRGEETVVSIELIPVVESVQVASNENPPGRSTTEATSAEEASPSPSHINKNPAIPVTPNQSLGLIELGEALAKESLERTQVKLVRDETINDTITLAASSRVNIEGTVGQPVVYELSGQNAQLRVVGEGDEEIRLAHVVIVDSRPQSTVPPIALLGHAHLDDCIIISRSTAIQASGQRATVNRCHLWQPADSEMPLFTLDDATKLRVQQSLLVGPALAGIAAPKVNAKSTLEMTRCTMDGCRRLATSAGLDLTWNASVFLSYGHWPQLTDTSNEDARCVTTDVAFIDIPPLVGDTSLLIVDALSKWQKITGGGAVFRQMPLPGAADSLLIKTKFMPPQASGLAESLSSGLPICGAELAELPLAPRDRLTKLPPEFIPSESDWETAKKTAALPLYPSATIGAIYPVGADKLPPQAIAPFSAADAYQYQKAWAQELSVSIDFENSLGMRFRVLPPGEFLMGSTVQEVDRLLRDTEANPSLGIYRDAYRSEGPQHKVILTKPVAIGVHEVTRGQFREFVEATGYKTLAEVDQWGGGGLKNGKSVTSKEFNWHTDLGYAIEQSDEHPVVNIALTDVQAFCSWLSMREGVQYRLPTEAEWEYACRAGSHDRYSFGNESTFLHAYARHSRLEGALPVGMKRPNAFGLFDMHGNAWEWCGSRFEAYQARAQRDPNNQSKNLPILRRGGCFHFGVEAARSAYRHSDPGEAARDSTTGFRIVRVFD